MTRSMDAPPPTDREFERLLLDAEDGRIVSDNGLPEELDRLLMHVALADDEALREAAIRAARAAWIESRPA